METTNYISFIIGVLIVGLVFTVPASAQKTATGSPDLDININDNELRPGEVNQVTIEFENNGQASNAQGSTLPSEVNELITKAEDVNVGISDISDNSIDADITDDISGNISKGNTKNLKLDIDVPKDFDNTFTITLDLDYEYSDRVDYKESPLNITNIQNDTEQQTRSLNFDTMDVPVIQIDDIEDKVAVGESDKVEISVRNVGSEDAESLTIENLQSGNQQLEIGEQTNSYFVGDLNSGSTSTFNVVFEYSDTATSGQDYLVEGTANYDYNGESDTDDIDTVVSPDDERQIDIDVDNDNLHVGGVGRLDIDLQNSNGIDLSDASVELTASSDSLAFNGLPNSNVRTSDSTSQQTRYIGRWDFGDQVEISTDIGFSDSAVANSEYLIDIVVNYETDEGVENTISEDLSISPDGERDIDIEVQEDNIPVDGFGTVDILVDNNEEFDIQNSELTLTSRSSTLMLGGRSNQVNNFIGGLDSDVGRVVKTKAEFSSDSVESQQYPVEAVLNYEDDNGIESTISRDISVSPEREQNVRVESDTFDLSEGESDEISFEINNEGPKDIEDVEVIANPRQDLSIEQETSTVGSIESSESKIVNYSAEAPLDSETLDQDIEITVEYTYENLPDTRSKEEVVSVSLESLDTEFSVTSDDTEIQQGGSGNMEITVTNNLDQTVSDIGGEFSASSPITVNDESVFLESLDPGEETTFNVQLSASGSASANPYSLDVDFQYEDESGDTRLSEVYNVQVDVTESESSGIGAIALVGGIIVIASIIVIIIGRRRNTFESMYNS